MSAATLLSDAAARYGREIDTRLARPAGPVPEWLAALRRDAARRFAETGFPTPKSEAWKYTPLKGLLEQDVHDLRDWTQAIDHNSTAKIQWVESRRDKPGKNSPQAGPQDRPLPQYDGNSNEGSGALLCEP